MKFTGTLIEELMAKVERAEQKAQSDEPLFAQLSLEHVDPWFIQLQDNTNYDSQFIGVA
jgi:hypothetical protein